MQSVSLNQCRLDNLHKRRFGLFGDAKAENTQENTNHKHRDAWCCNVCLAAVCLAQDRIQIQGEWIHCKINPAGQNFELACFRSALGCEQHGLLTLEYSWFSGYRWQYAYCRRCNIQLGWYFMGVTNFYGLILAALRECKGDFSARF